MPLACRARIGRMGQFSLKRLMLAVACLAVAAWLASLLSTSPDPDSFWRRWVGSGAMAGVAVGVLWRHVIACAVIGFIVAWIAYMAFVIITLSRA